MTKSLFALGVLIMVSACVFWYVLAQYALDPRYAEFLARAILPFFTFGAVLLAIFADFLKAWVDPIRVRIEIPKESNTVFDKALLDVDGMPVDKYVHHLCVRNLTPHKPLEDCRVWLKKIFIQQIDGAWVQENRFAVPRLMQWAPSEYSGDKRTFAGYQVFDFGATFSNNEGFQVEVNPAQGGNFNRRFQVGKTVGFVLYVSANNYHKEKEFFVQVSIPQSVLGEKVTISKISMVKKFSS